MKSGRWLWCHSAALVVLKRRWRLGPEPCESTIPEEYVEKFMLRALKARFFSRGGFYAGSCRLVIASEQLGRVNVALCEIAPEPI